MLSLLLSFLASLWRFAFSPCQKRVRSERKVDVAIVGAGFGGLYLARELGNDDRFRVRLLEPKTFSEYTPGVMKAVVTPEHLRALHASLQEAVPASVEIIQGTCEGIQDGKAGGSSPHLFFKRVGSHASDALERLDFDVCIIATGSSYRRPYKADHVTALDADFRYRELLSSHDSLKESAHAVVIGAGPVGVELAAEILHKWPKKKLTVVNFAPSVLFGMDPIIGQAAHHWLEERGARILLDTEVTHESDFVAEDVGDFAPKSSRRAEGTPSDSSATTTSLDSLLTPGSGPADGAGGSALRLRHKAKQSAEQNGSSSNGLNSSLPPRKQRLLITQKGERIIADVVLHCAGVVPNTSFISNAPTTLTSANLKACLVPPPPPPALPSAPRVSTDRFLRVTPWPAAVAASGLSAEAASVNALFFAVGDAARHPYGEPALAHTAEKHAECVLRSLRSVASHLEAEAALNKSEPDRRPMWLRVADAVKSDAEASLTASGTKQPTVLLPYPQALTGAPTAPIIMDVSLGPYEALLAFDCLSLTDRYVGRRLAALMKTVLETTKVMQMRNQAVGKVFWHYSDEIALMVHGKITGPLGKWLAERKKRKQQQAQGK